MIRDIRRIKQALRCVNEALDAVYNTEVGTDSLMSLRDARDTLRHELQQVEEVWDEQRAANLLEASRMAGSR